MKREIKAIPTVYNGICFRSRLEARWAIFFDNIGLCWEYEPQGYTDGKLCYIPDFWIPQLKCYMEVKPEYPSASEEAKGEVVVQKTKNTLYFLVGPPRHRDHDFSFYNGLFWCSDEDEVRFHGGDDGDYWWCCRDCGHVCMSYCGSRDEASHFCERGDGYSDRERVDRAVYAANNYPFWRTLWA